MLHWVVRPSIQIPHPPVTRADALALVRTRPAVCELRAKSWADVIVKAPLQTHSLHSHHNSLSIWKVQFAHSERLIGC